MSDWLDKQNVKYLEQPLQVGDEGNLPQLYQRSPLPIFVDESCFQSEDIIKLSSYWTLDKKSLLAYILR